MRWKPYYGTLLTRLTHLICVTTKKVVLLNISRSISQISYYVSGITGACYRRMGMEIHFKLKYSFLGN